MQPAVQSNFVGVLSAGLAVKNLTIRRFSISTSLHPHRTIHLISMECRNVLNCSLHIAWNWSDHSTSAPSPPLLLSLISEISDVTNLQMSLRGRCPPCCYDQLYCMELERSLSSHLVTK